MKVLRRLYRLCFPKKPCCLLGEGSQLYAQSNIVNLQQRKELIAIGESSHVLGELTIFAHGGRIQIGNDCYIGPDSRIWAAELIEIGNRVLIAHQVNIFDNQTHPVSARKRHEHFKTIFTTGHPKEIDLNERPVIIEDDVWIACSSIILRGVHIGQGAIIGAGSVVSKDVPAWTVVAGNPAKEIRQIAEHER